MRDAARGPAGEGGADERLVRHMLADRIFHWVTAAAVLVLLVTSFAPILGYKFAWVMPHWIAGVLLAALLLYHIVRALVWLDPWAMAFGVADVRAAWHWSRWILRRTVVAPPKPGKYSPLQKLLHLGAAALLLVATATGLVIMAKIDTPWWRRNPYWLGDQTWGVIYVLHDLAALALITLIMIHVYFALRPEKLLYTRSMILGWITRREYLDHHDPERWSVAARGAAPSAAPRAEAEP